MSATTRHTELVIGSNASNTWLDFKWIVWPRTPPPLLDTKCTTYWATSPGRSGPLAGALSPHPNGVYTTTSFTRIAASLLSLNSTRASIAWAAVTTDKPRPFEHRLESQGPVDEGIRTAIVNQWD